MKKEIEVIGWIFYILAVVLIILMIGMLFWKLTGHSPTETTIILGGLGILSTLQILILTVLFQMKGKIGELTEFKRQTNEFKKQTIEKIKEIENKK